VPLFQVQHSALFGSTMGSLSLRPDLQLHTCEAIAMERTWQAALLGLPFGGASYGLVCDPDELSERELLRLFTCAAQRLRFQPGRQAIIFPGGSCRRECIAKLFAETRESGNLIVTGKPDCLAGLNLDRFQAEGLAAIVSGELRRIGKQPAAAKVAIQGFGPLGQAVSERLASEALVLVALSDNSGGLYRADGLIFDDIRSRYDREPVLFGYSEAEAISRADLLQVKSDVLVLTSGSNEIHGKNIQVIPWSIATSGALLGACFESCQSQITDSLRDLLFKTHACVERTLGAVVRYARDNEESVTQAARQIALERVASCARLCGRGN